MKKYCFMNGNIVEEKNACISPYDLGILRGYGVFDFMCSTNNKPFLLHDHWMRLKRSAGSLGITLPINEKEYKKVLIELITKNSYENPAIRTVLTAGTSINGISLENNPTFYILLHDMNKLIPKAHMYKNGTKLITHDFARDNYASKTTNYIEAIKKQKERNRRGAIEVLYINRNTVLECTTANIFIVKNNKLLTPQDGVLPGITRKLVLQLARKNKITTKETRITKRQLLTADEVFITGSAKHILPVVKINSVKIGTSTPGFITQKISELYFNYLHNY